MEKQEAMIRYQKGNQKHQAFFFKHDFQSAYQHAMKFVERNQSKFAMDVYTLNSSSFGPKWRHEQHYPKIETEPKITLLIASLFEHRDGFTPDELVKTLDKNGLTTRDADQLIAVLLSQGYIEMQKDGTYIVA